jgi:flagellar hook-length control protein FliK
VSNIGAMGLPGPAPAATGAKASSQAGATGKAGSFGQALQTHGATNPTPESQGTGPPGQDPGSLDTQAVIQALPGDGTAVEGQTETTGTTQLDRLAEVGMTGTDEQDEIPLDGLPFVVLTQQQAPPAAAISGLTGRALAETKAPVGQPVAGDVVRPDVLSGELPETASPVATAARMAARGEVAPAVLQAVAEQQALKAQATQPAAPATSAEAALVEAPAVTALPAADVATTPEPAVEMTAELLVEPAASEPVSDAPDVELPQEPVAPVTETLEMAAAEMEGGADTSADAPDLTLPLVSALPPTSRGSAPTVTAETGVSEVPAAGTFASDLAGTVRRAALVGDNELRLLLNPPELGHVNVRIIDSPNGLRVVMEAANAEAHELIERQLPTLRAALESRDLRIDRIQIERSAETSEEDALDRGSRDALGNQSGNPGSSNQDGERGHQTAPWSSVAAMRSNGTPAEGEPPAGAKSQSAGPTEVRGSAAPGRLDVLA